MNYDLPIKVTVWTDENTVQRVALAPASTFSYHIHGPHLTLDSYFESYLKGENPPLPPLNLAPLTPFLKKVLYALATIPFGKSATYGELAAQIGSPRAARAVGGALGRNPFPLLLPCHRILAQGGIGGFSAGPNLKEKLLEYESLF